MSRIIVIIFIGLLYVFQPSYSQGNGNKVDSILTLGYNLNQQGEISKAMAQFNIALSISPKDYRIYLYRGIAKTSYYIYLCNQNPEYALGEEFLDAENDFNKALELTFPFENNNELDYNTYNQLAYLYYNACLFEWGNNAESFKRGIDMAEKIILLHIDDPMGYYWKAMMVSIHHFPDNKLAPVSFYFDEAIKRAKNHPSASNVYFQYGYYEYNNSEFNSAYDKFDTSAKLDSNMYSAIKYRGICSYKLERIDASITDLTKYINAFPDDREAAVAYKYRGKALFKKTNNINKACLDMKKAESLGDAEAKAFVKDVCK